MIAFLNTPLGLYAVQVGARAWIIPHARIANIQIKKTDRYKLLLQYYPDEYTHLTPLEFDYDDVSIPLSTSPADLRTKIFNLNIPQSGLETFIALGGQTTYTIQKDKFYENVYVFVNGVGLADTAFTVVSDTITFTAPFAGGEQVKVFIV